MEIHNIIHSAYVLTCLLGNLLVSEKPLISSVTPFKKATEAWETTGRGENINLAFSLTDYAMNAVFTRPSIACLFSVLMYIIARCSFLNTTTFSLISSLCIAMP
jgi:hypothetical protein